MCDEMSRIANSMPKPQRGPGKQSSAAQSIIAKQQHARDERRGVKKRRPVFAVTIDKRCLSFVAKLSWLEHLQHLDHVVRLEKRAAAGWFASAHHLPRKVTDTCTCFASGPPAPYRVHWHWCRDLGEPKSLTPQCSDTPEKIHCGGEPPGPVSAA
jgi:hypothetical protein